MRTTEHLGFANPDEVRTFPHGRAEILNTSAGAVGRLVLEPGWQWSKDVKPAVGTEWCEAPHFQYHASGRLQVRMADGTEFEAGPGDITSLPAGHDAWVVGDEPVVLVDFFGATDYAKRAPAPG
jgi:hypothetical protein